MSPIREAYYGQNRLRMTILNLILWLYKKNQPYAFVVFMYSAFISFRAANTAFVLSTAFSSVIFPLSKDFWISFNRFFIRRFVLESKNILSLVMRQPKNGTPRKVFPNTGIFRKSSSFSRQKRSTSSSVLHI